MRLGLQRCGAQSRTGRREDRRTPNSAILSDAQYLFSDFADGDPEPADTVLPLTDARGVAGSKSWDDQEAADAKALGSIPRAGSSADRRRPKVTPPKDCYVMESRAIRARLSRPITLKTGFSLKEHPCLKCCLRDKCDTKVLLRPRG